MKHKRSACERGKINMRDECEVVAIQSNTSIKELFLLEKRKNLRNPKTNQRYLITMAYSK